MIVVLGLLLLGSQTLPSVQPVDCDALLAAPSPGIEQLCDAEAAMRRAAAAPGGSPERLEHWTAAAGGYARAADVLRATELRIHALEMLVRLNDVTHLRNPESVETALRALAQVDLGRPDRLMRLATFQEEEARRGG